MKKRLFSLFLALVMVLGMLPATALAAGDPVAKIGETTYTKLQDAIDAATAGDTVTLVADVTEDVTVTKNLTIDGADKNYTGKMTLNKVTVTIENVNFVKGQVYKHKSTGAAGTYTIKNCDFDGQGLNDYAVNLGGTGSIVIENVTAKDYGFGLLQVPASNNSVSIKDVEISNTGYAIKVDYSNGVSLENVVIKDSTYGFVNSNFGAKTITVKECSFGADYPVVIWDRNTTKVNTFKFEGENDFGSNAFYYNNVTEAEMAYTKYVLTEGATLTAVEGLAVTTDVEDGRVVYENGVYKVKMPPELPKANANDVEGNDELTFALNFTIDTSDMTPEEIAEVFEYYKDYFVDFELTFNKDVTLDANGTGDGYLAGQYDAWNPDAWVKVPFNGAVTLAADQPIMIMDYAANTFGEPGLRQRLWEIAEVVQDFDCGVYLTPEYLAANPDLVVTLKLNLYKPTNEDNSNSPVMVGPYGKASNLGTYVFTTPKTFTIVYRNWYDGTNQGTYTQTVSTGRGVTLTANKHQRYGYEFDHWNSKRDTDDGAFNFTDGQTLTSAEVNALYEYAKKNDGKAYLNTYWKGRTFTITYRSWYDGTNHGTYTQTATYGEELTLTANKHQRYGYEFDHWNSKRDTDDGAFNFTDAQTLTAEEVNALYEYAKDNGTAWLNTYWKGRTFTVTFRNWYGNTNHGTYTQTATYGEELELKANTFKRTGYTFDHWNSKRDTNDGAFNFADQAVVTVEDVNAMYDYAKEYGTAWLNTYWTPNTYTVTLDPNGGTVDPTEITVTYDAAYGTLPVPTLTGYKFLGWVDEAGNEVTAETVYTVAGDSTLTAKWEVNKYTVTLDPTADGKVSPATVTVAYNEKIGELPVPTWAKSTTKATFLGWFDEAGNEVTAETVYTVLGDSTFTAKWLVHPGSSSTNVTKELFTIQCTEVHEHSWLCNWFGSHVKLVSGSVKWNEELGRWEAQAKIGSSMLSNINNSTTKKNYFGGFTHHYDESNYVFDLYYDPNFTGLNSQGKEVTGMWLPVKEYVVPVYCYTEPAGPDISKISTTALKVLDADAAYKGTSYQGKYTVKQLIDGTYTVGEMYTKDGKFYADLTITDLAPYISALSTKNGKNYVLPEWENHHTAEDFKYTLVYTGSTTDYKQDGTGWSVDASSWVNNTEKLNGKYLWVTEQFTVTYTDGLNGEVFADESYTVYAFTENGATKNAVTDFSATATPAFTGSTARKGYTFLGWDPAVAETVTADVTYTAKWEKTVYNITVDANEGGTVEVQSTATMDEIVKLTILPNKGWKVVKAELQYTVDGNSYTSKLLKDDGTTFSVFSMPAADVTIVVEFEQAIFDITVNATEGGTVEVQSTATMDEIVKLAITPDKGWKVVKAELQYIGANSGSPTTTNLLKADGSTATVFRMPAADVTVVVEFEKVLYNITFEECVGGKVVATVDGKEVTSAYYGDEVVFVVTPDEGWELKSMKYKILNNGSQIGGGNAAGTLEIDMPAGDVVLTPVFEKVIYNIVIAPVEHGTVVAKVNGVEANTATIGDVIELVVTPDEGYKLNQLNYYFTLANGGAGGKLNPGETLTMRAGDVRISAVFEACQYTVTFDVNGGDALDPATKVVTFDAAYGELPTPTRRGYTFDGWFLGNTKVEANTQVKTAADHTLVAAWTANTYILTCKSEPTNFEQSKNVVYDQPVGELPTPERTGYTFGGWFDDAGKQWTATSIVDFIDTKILFADWTANKYTVTLDANGGEVAPTEITVIYDSPYSELPEPAKREGYTFINWTLNGAEVNAATIVKTAADHTLVAQWEINKHSVTFDVTGKWFAEDETVNKVVKDVVYATSVQPIDAEKANYKFSGWTTKDAYTVGGNTVAAGTALPVTMPDQDITVVGSYRRYITDGELTLDDYDVIYTGAAQKPVVTLVVDGVTLVEGTDFTVEYKDNVGNEADAKGVATVIVTGIGDYIGELTTRFEFLYTVTFVSEGITTPDKQYVKYGDVAINPGPSVMHGCDFAGWYIDGKTAYNFSTPVTAPITLKAKFLTASIGGVVVPPANNASVTVNGLNTVDHMAYIIGSGDGKVNPLGTITRAEVATIFFRLMQDDFRAKYWDNQSSYADVAADAWYNVAVATLENAGIIKDTVTGGNFRPTALITRAELAVMAAQFALVNGEVPANTFVDVPATYWAAAEIAVVQYAGWIEGNNGMYRPDANLTRAECMTIVNRMLQRGAEAENMLATMTTFTDNAVGTWYYEAVQEATNSHTYNRTEAVLTGESFLGEKWVKMEAAPDWAALEKAWAEA